MPHTDRISDAALDDVAQEVGKRLPRLLGSALPPTTAVTITASFAVWNLSSDRVEAGVSDDLDALAARTGRVHHQIAVDGQPLLYARSVLDHDTRTVEEVTVSPTAKRIDAAIDWIDANVPEDDLARLLEAPAYHLLAIWLVGDGGKGRVLVVEAASRLADLVGLQLRPESELLRRLRAIEPVGGIDWRDRPRDRPLV
jgi:hypothetical protein